ncbi:MAG: glycosyltransferase family 4 protein [Acidobacteriota bacterium]|nr:glycosyltransferase family 4 protein [Acidobacteriota bacterium]
MTTSAQRRRAGGDRLRVALDATPLFGRRAGVAAFCSGAFAALSARADLDVSAFAVTWRNRGQRPPALPSTVRWEQRIMPAGPLHRAWLRAPFPPVEWFIGPRDVVHGTNFVVPPSRRAARVVAVHDLTFVRYPELCSPAALVYAPLVRRAVAEGAWVHCPSRFVVEEVLAELGAEADRVRLVPYGVPSHAFHTAGTPASATGARTVADAGVSLPTGTTRYVLAIGTLEPRKDLPTLVRAFDGVAAGRPDLALVLAGAPGWGTAALDDAVEAMRFHARVVRPGYLDDAQLAALLAGAALLAYPSLYEGFGFPPLEAMAAGVPVVATDVGSIPEVVGDAGVLVSAGDGDALAGAMAGVLDDHDRRAALVAAGLRRAAGFTWEACGSALATLYREADADRRSSG